MEWLAVGFGFFLLVLILLALFWRPLKQASREIVQEKARELFVLQRERLELLFFQAAAASGKPRGLRWVDCQFESPFELARELETGNIVAMMPVEIRFEAIEGSDMEGVAAVGNIRAASALFSFARGEWRTSGRAVMNLSPDQVLERYEKQYQRIPSAGVPRVS